MKIYRKIDKKQRLTIPKDILSQVGIKELDEVRLDIINLNGKNAIIIDKKDDKIISKKVLKE